MKNESNTISKGTDVASYAMTFPRALTHTQTHAQAYTQITSGNIF